MLGQEIHMELEQDNTAFLEEKLENIRKAKGFWQGRNLGYRGRQIVGNTYLNSQIQYLLYNMNFSMGCVKKFEESIMEFVNKKKISRKNNFYRTTSDGGLGGPNIWARLEGA